MSYSGQSNPPWQRNTLGNAGQTNLQTIQNQMGLQNQQMHYQNQSIFNQNMNMSQQSSNQNIPYSQISGNMNQMQASPQPLFSQAVSYPGNNNRGLNPIAFSTNTSNQQQSSGGGSSGHQGQHQQQNQASNYNTIGTVTKLHNDCGFVDDEVFFHKSVCKGAIPKMGDRVLVEATFNQTTPFKWTATRIQIVPSASGGTVQRNQPPPLMSANVKGSGYNAVPPPNEYARVMGQQRRISPSRRSPERHPSSRDSRHREEVINNIVSHVRNKHDISQEENDRKRRRDERDRERDRPREKREATPDRRERSPIRRSSPKRRRTRTIPRYMVQIPKYLLTLTEADVLELRRRYTNMYIPSDFFFSQIRWSESFPPHKPFSIQRPCYFHIMHKSVDPPQEKSSVDPIDADYLFSAKVMLMGAPPIAELYQKCLQDEKDRDGERDFIHPTRLINFLVGIRGKNETMAIGGPWSPSLDGPNPHSDPSILIKTAIRTCKSLTGIDLSGCTQWYRFVELYYHRAESTHKGRLIPARVETVVIFLPDINSCMPTRIEWDNLHRIYKTALDRVLNHDDTKNPSLNSSTLLASISNSGVTTDGTGLGSYTATASGNIDEHGNEKDETVKREPTHYSELDPKTMKIQDLREELLARNLSAKGLKPQLIARLHKALNTEKLEDKTKNNTDSENKPKEDVEMEQTGDTEQQDEDHVEVDMKDLLILDEYDSNKVPENTSKKDPPKKLDEKERQHLERRYQLPESPHILVHPSKTAKSGKFDCTVMSLSVLLDYRPEDTKERSFEVSIFAELFNEMLMRDFGFNIYREIALLPEKAKEKDDAKDKDEKATEQEKEDKTKDSEKKENNENERTRERRMSESEKSDKKSSKEKERRMSKKSYDDDTEDDDISTKSGDRRKRSKAVVAKPQLLLSFVYFDTTHCGYIFEKDLEDLFYIIGLNLSRAQVRKLLNKVISRDAIYYRKLTDKPKDDESDAQVNAIESNGKTEESMTHLALGNKALLPVFEDLAKGKIKSTTSALKSNVGDETSGMVMFNGGLVDVGKLVEQMKRSEKAREDIEAILIELRKQNSDLQNSCSKANNKIKDLQSETKSLNKKLSDTDHNLSSLNKKHNEHYSILSSIYDKVSPIFIKSERNSKTESSRDKERDREREKDREREREKDKDDVKESSKEIKKET